MTICVSRQYQPNQKLKSKKAGRILVDNSASTTERDAALELADKWRVCHGYPINTFQSTLHRKLQSGFTHGSIVSQRLKRMPTIIDKLKREPQMQPTTMQDIGGVRAVLRDPSEVYRLTEQYRDKVDLSMNCIVNMTTLLS